jgi:SAM domain (Sterile alpha motif)
MASTLPSRIAVDIAAWLRELRLERFESVFRDNEIDWEVLPELTEGDLEKLGLPLGPRKKLRKGDRRPVSQNQRGFGSSLIISDTALPRGRAAATDGDLRRPRRLDGAGCETRPGGNA